MEHIIDFDKSQVTLENLFRKIAEGNVILFLGAGASITNKKYLSKHLIEYYEAKVGIDTGIDNIVEFVDVLSANNTFSRSDFDLCITEALRNLEVEDTHRTIAAIPWREIITTNYDLLIEKANEEVLRKSNDIKEIIPIRSAKQYNRLCASNETKYVKLNGCISDRSAYPLVFSTNDFQKAKSFYKIIVNQFKEPSPNIEFLFIGYSFSDDFAQHFFETFDKGREKRWIYSIDPFVSDIRLPYYKEKRISIVKTTSSDFFNRYNGWLEENAELKNRALNAIQIKDNNNNPIFVSQQLRQKFHNVIEPLNNDCREYINAQDFYLGEEPNYNVIRKGYDVIKKSKLEEIKNIIIDKTYNNEHNLIPLFLLTGSFGTGKTTFTYRLIHELINNTKDFNAIAFEIKDFDKFKVKDFCTLIEKTKCQNVIIHSNYIEHSSIYKSLIELRAALSTRQDDINYIFIQSVRENILSIHNKRSPQKNINIINIDSPLNIEETNDFLEKLRDTGLSNWRDTKEKELLAKKISREYKGDSYISLLGLIENGKHIEDLKDAYTQLSGDCKKAFIYTALVHRYNIFMPASLLKDLISMNWDDFMANVIKVEGKGILIQENTDSNGLEPDLYFRTKHSLIAERLVGEILYNKQKKYDHYKNLFAKIHESDEYCKFAIYILKSLEQNKEFTTEQINKLYDIAYIKLSDNPYYVLRYTINLQHRGNKEEIKKALKHLIYAEGLLEKKNHKFMHRRGVLNVELAKIYFKEERIPYKTIEHIHEAKELFYAKQTYDPCSHYSYYDLLALLIWELKSVKLEKEEQLILQIEIEEQFELAYKSITDGIERIARLENLYKKFKKDISYSSIDYLSFLKEFYQEEYLRPYACILLYNYYENAHEYEKLNDIIEELELYSDYNEVVNFLFKYYGNRLNYVDCRLKFLDLNKRVDLQGSLMYNYYMYVAESYNSNFRYGRQFLRNIENKYLYLNPDYQQGWKEPDSDEMKIFEGSIRKNDKGYVFKSTDLQSFFIISNKHKFKLKDGMKAKANLSFLLNGIRAIIIEIL
jgi:hypothetical protein